MRKQSPKKKTLKEENRTNDIVRSNNDNVLNLIKMDIKYKNSKQKKLVESIKNNIITICAGSPGTGKTYLSCYQALVELKTSDCIRKIVIVKSVTTLEGEELGYLKGSMSEKLEPASFSFIHNFEKLIGKDNTQILKDAGMIEMLPIAYMRGISIDNAIVIIDELQNINIKNLRTILSRLGENSRMVFLGDVNQVDMKKKNESSLRFMLDNFTKLTEVGIIEFTKEDIVRHPLISKFEDIFDEKLNKSLPNF